MATPQQESERAGTGFSSTAYGRQGNRSVRKLLIKCDVDFTWEDRQNKVLEILGYTSYGTEKEFKRFLPWFDPEDRMMPAVRCETRGVAWDSADPEFTADALQPMATANRYKEIEFTIYFESVRQNFGVFEDINDPDEPQLGRDEPYEQYRYTVKRIRPGREYISAKNGQFIWADDAGLPDTARPAVPFPIPEILPYQEIDVTWLDIPIEAYPITAIADCMGKVNSLPIDLPGPGDLEYVEESLLLQAVSEEEVYFPNGDLAYNLTYHFKYRSNETTVGPIRVGWNVYPRPDGTFRAVFRKGTSTGVFLTADFNALFVPEGS
jgi:hypothetical protein